MLLEINFPNDLRTKILLENLEEKKYLVYSVQQGKIWRLNFKIFFPMK